MYFKSLLVVSLFYLVKCGKDDLTDFGKDKNLENSRCVHGWGTLSICQCDDGWEGQLCDTVNCGSRGRKIDKTHCHCNSGYEGDACEIFNCDRGHKFGLRCSCDLSWEGDLCDQRKCVHGERIDNNDCSCNSGWTGESCDSVDMSSSENFSSNIVTFIVFVVVIICGVSCCIVIARRSGRCARYRSSGAVLRAPQNAPVVMTAPMGSTSYPAQMYTPVPQPQMYTPVPQPQMYAPVQPPQPQMYAPVPPSQPQMYAPVPQPQSPYNASAVPSAPKPFAAEPLPPSYDVAVGLEMHK